MDDTRIWVLVNLGRLSVPVALWRELEALTDIEISQKWLEKGSRVLPMKPIVWFRPKSPVATWGGLYHQAKNLLGDSTSSGQAQFRFKC